MASSLSDRPARGSEDSYAQILRSSALIGGATALNLLVGLIRNKAIAMLLGPAGIGLVGVLTSIADLARSIAQLGINASGVRQIAEAVGSGDQTRIARTVIVLRRVSVCLGVLGAASLIVSCRPVSHWAFGNHEYATGVAWLGLAVLFKIIADSQAALLQGMRRIADLAAIGVLGAIVAAVVSIALAAGIGEEGIAPSLAAAAFAAMVISWMYARKVRVESAHANGLELREEAGSLLKLGLAFMASAMLTTGAAFAVRALVLRWNGVDAAGFYQAAWTIGGMYVGFVLQAMGTDFYPRLVGIIQDRTASNRLVNEQATVSMLLAGPGIVGTIVFAAPAMTVLYSAEFGDAVDTLRWVCLGMGLRVITWPLGYIILAQNRRLVFFATELAWTIVNIALSAGLISRYGITGAGVAFFLSYIFHGFLVYPIVSSSNGFRVSRANAVLGIVLISSTCLALLAVRALSSPLALSVGALVFVLSCAFSAVMLIKLMPDARLPAAFGSVQRLVCRTFTRSSPRSDDRRDGMGNQ